MGRFKWCSVCVCLLFIIASSLSGCKTNVDDTTTTMPDGNALQDGSSPVAADTKTLRLSYSKSDSMNPYFAQSLNNQTLMPLLFESLFTLDKGYNAKNSLAGGFSYQGLNLHVSIASGKKFSDGSTISAADVVYSFQKAKGAPAYKEALASVKNAAVSGNTVIFSLNSADLYAQNLFTFPIVKNGSAEKADSSPIGSGLYKRSGGQLVYSKGAKPRLATITLVNAASQDSIANSLKVGNVSLIFKDLSEGSFSRLSSRTVETPLNHLVYLGINAASPLLGQEGVRQALNHAVNRTALVNSAYQGHARIAKSPFNPDWAPAKDVKTGADAVNSDGVKTAMESAGFALDAKTHLWKKGAQTASLKILVNQENAFRVTAANMLADQLKEQGISATVSAVKFSEYTSLLASSKFDLYVGEVRLADNMSLSPFFDGGTAAAGVGAATKATKETYSAYRTGTGQIEAFTTAFEKEIPFVPLCYRNGLTAYSNEMKGAVAPLPGNVFAGVTEWSF